MDKNGSEDEITLALFPDVVRQETVHKERAFTAFRQQCLPCFITVLGALDCAGLYNKAIEKSLRHAFKTKIADGPVEACIEAFHFLWNAAFPHSVLRDDLYKSLEAFTINKLPAPKLFIDVVKHVDY